MWRNYLDPGKRALAKNKTHSFRIFGLALGHAACLMILLAALLVTRAAPAEAQAQRTVAGIALDQPWRRSVYEHAREKLQHSAWGWRHSERDFLLAREIAHKENLTIDEDVLFAAAFLHDAGAIAPFAQEGVDHAVRSAELAEPLLRQWGFPMEKFSPVKAAILSHMWDENVGASAEATVLHDADTLDFLGATGVARRISVTGRAPDMDAVLALARTFSRDLPPQLITRAAKRMGAERVKAMKVFFDQLKRETPMGAPL